MFGTDRPGSPPTPVSYQVFEGWNMVGFTADWLFGVAQTKANEDYLWNWVSFAVKTYGMIYGWTPGTQTWVTQLPGVTDLVPGAGYWIPFQSDGYIYP